MQKSWSDMSREQSESLEKSQAMDSLSASVNRLFFRARGYYAFKIENELDLAYKEIDNVQEDVEKLRKLKLNTEEHQLVDDLSEFLVIYKESSLPNAVSLVRNNDYEGLRKRVLEGSNATVNRFISYSSRYNERVQDDHIALLDKTEKKVNFLILLFTVLGSTILIATILMFWRVINNVIRPIEKMKSAADKYQNGQEFAFQPIVRSDEIGALSESFATMMLTIRTKEDELMAQNEELIVQQDELYTNQKKMEYALSEACFSKIRLERYNGLNHILSFTMDKQKLVEDVLNYFDDLYNIDLGMLWLSQHPEFHLKSISNDMFASFLENQYPYIKLRLEKEPYFISKREASYEKGIAMTETYVYDFVAATKNSDNEFGIILGLTRVGRPFSKEDAHDIYGLLNRVALAIDRIEQYEKANHERVLNKSIIDNITEGIQFVSKSGITERQNRAIQKIFNLQDFEEDIAIVQDEWLEYISSKVEDPESLKDFFVDALASNIGSISQTSYTIPGKVSRVIDVYSVPVLIDNEKAGTIFVHRDITQEHEMDRMKTELVSTVSHELRTPLSSVLGFTELLLTRDMEPKKQKRYLETIQKEAKRLTNLVNDFLDLQRMEHGNLSYTLSDIDLLTVAQETVEGFQVNTSHRFTIIEETMNTAAYADADRIRQVFTNLVSNAIKFSPDGGEITITLSIRKDDIVVSIQDEGIGIPKSEAPNMFGKFQRFDSGYSRKIGGTGLGLAICKEIIESHEGVIWIDSEIGEGTTVYFTLPLQKNLKLESTTDHVHYTPTIMILEDDASIALLLAEELKAKGYSVTHKSTVQSAFDYAKNNLPACIVVDILLGTELNGWDLIKLLKDEPKTTDIPIIISSALDKHDESIKKFDIQYYMTKPYQLQQVSEKITDILNKE